MSFASILQGLRKERKVTQEELAQNLGVSAQAVSKWENGSYPEGDLIPRIADFFHVSIDFLYGRAGKETSIEQRVVTALQELWESYRQSGADRECANKAFIEKIHSLIWAFHVGAWVENNDYYPRPDNMDEQTRMASVYTNNFGYSYLSLAKNREFYVFLKQPDTQEGFSAWLEHSDEIRKFFRFLSDKTNMEILASLYQMKGGEYVRRETLCRKLGISCEKADQALEYLTGMRVGSGNEPVLSVSVINEKKQAEKAYGVNMNMGGLLFSLLAVADAYIHAPCGYNLQIMNRSREWGKGN